MSVLIKDMEMPENCLNCPMCNGNDECVLQSEEDNALFETWEEQKDGCPLVEVPEPYGEHLCEDEVVSCLEGADWINEVIRIFLDLQDEVTE